MALIHSEIRWCPMRSLRVAFVTLLAFHTIACFAFELGSGKAPAATLTQETSEETKARHTRVAKRRGREVVICHRGALEFAHENTLEAYRAAFQLGADGNEIDIRATQDGVLVCFHDDMLDMILAAYGDVSEYSWKELQTFRFRRPGKFGEDCRIPTLSEVFQLHRRHAGLMHLDVKRPGLDKGIARMLTRLDIWDHVMSVGANCPAIVDDPRYRSIQYKAGLYLDRAEVDEEQIVARLKQPGGAVMVEDPRGTLVVLGRKIGQPSARPVSPRSAIHASHGDARSVNELITTLHDAADWNRVAESPDDQAAAAKRIKARARAADELARRHVTSKDAVAALQQRVRDRSLHRDWRYHGLDGSAALRALMQLKAPHAVELARFSLWRNDAALEVVRNRKYDTPRAWTDFRVKLVAFRELEMHLDRDTEELCRDYLALNDREAEIIGPLQFEAAARALLSASPCKQTAIELLSHRRSEVRGRTILYCVANADQKWANDVLQSEAPHALAYVISQRSALPTPKTRSTKDKGMYCEKFNRARGSFVLRTFPRRIKSHERRGFVPKQLPRLPYHEIMVVHHQNKEFGHANSFSVTLRHCGLERRLCIHRFFI